MQDTKVARRYANSLLGLAIERQIADKVNEDMLLVATTCKQNRELSLLFKNPIVNSDKKEAIMNGLFGSKVDAVSFSFMKIIARKGREHYLEEIAAAYTSLYKHFKGVKSGVVTTAFPMDAGLRAQIMDIIKRAKGDSIELKEEINKEIIGGFILRIGDVEYDASISNKLKALKNEFDDNLYVKQY